MSIMTSLTAESATGNSRAGAGAHARSAAADASALSTADIIVVDDSRTVVKLLEMGLRNAGLSVGVASEAARDSRWRWSGAPT